MSFWKVNGPFIKHAIYMHEHAVLFSPSTTTAAWLFCVFRFFLQQHFQNATNCFVQCTIYKWVYGMRTANCENISEIFNPNIFHLKIIFTNDEPHIPHWPRNMCNSMTKNNAETNTRSSSISDISQDVEEAVRCTSIFIWTNSFYVYLFCLMNDRDIL